MITIMCGILNSVNRSNKYEKNQCIYITNDPTPPKVINSVLK